jgi:hypothetical protein
MVVIVMTATVMMVLLMPIIAIVAVIPAHVARLVFR